MGPIFETRLADAFPLRSTKVMNAIRDTRGGRTTDGRFSSRMVGQGARWAAIEGLFSTQCQRLGLDYLEGEVPETAPPSVPDYGPQLPLAF